MTAPSGTPKRFNQASIRLDANQSLAYVEIQTAAGAPSHAAPKGSLYLRNDGAEGTLLYVNNDGSTDWTAVPQTGGGALTSLDLDGALDQDHALTAAGDAQNVALTINHATAAAEGIDVAVTQLTTARSSGQVSAVKASTTSLAGDSGGTYASFEAAVTDGGGSADHSALKVGAGFDQAIDAEAAATGEARVAIGDNLASAWEWAEGATTYLKATTTNGSEAVAAEQRLTTTDGVASGTVRVVGGRAYSSVAVSTAITGTTETATAFDETYVIPANTLKAGSVVSIRSLGQHTATTGSETHDMELLFGPDSLVDTTGIDPADNDIFWHEGCVVVRTAGATGTAIAFGSKSIGALGAAPVTWGTVEFVIDTTATIEVQVQIDRQASATDSDSALLQFLLVDIA